MQKFEKLSRAEMKNVLGGKESGGNISCSFSGSCSSYPSTSYPAGDGDSATIVQNYMDDWCYAHDCCTDVDCAGAN